MRRWPPARLRRTSITWAFLLQLCELELVDRERRAAERRLKAARFPSHKTSDEFDFAAQPSVNKPLVLELIACQYLQKRENLILVGASGTGKTHLATALGVAACRLGRRSASSRDRADHHPHRSP